MSRHQAFVSMGLFALAACGGAAREEGTGLTGTSASAGTVSTSGEASGGEDGSSEGSEAGTSAGTSASTTAGTSATTGSSDGGTRLDVGGGSGPEGGSAESGASGCDKVDFLFVVDNSGSMSDEQQILVNNFPKFITAIRDTLKAQDYHIMVVSTDSGMNTGLMSSCTNGVCNCQPAPLCCQNACGSGGTMCNGFDCNNLPISACDTEWGSGRMYGADGTFCNIADMKRWMNDTQPNIDQTFACVAEVGTYGSGDEKPMQALGAAISAMQNDPGGCDEGFLRRDAVLVVTFITDEEDDGAEGSPGNPADWAAAVAAAKGNDPNAIVVLGLIGDGDQPGAICMSGDPNGGGDGAEPSPRLREFVGMFPNGVVGSVCAADYEPFFLDAVDVIDTTCDNFVPPG